MATTTAGTAATAMAIAVAALATTWPWATVARAAPPESPGADDERERGSGFEGVYGADSLGEGEAAGAEPAGTEITGEGNVPETHTVRKGDTLWRISESYFRDPWRWPKVWAQNPDIANPHWIFPGQSIRLRPPSGEAPREIAAPAPAGVLRLRPAAEAPPESHRLRQLGFVDEGALASAGVINGSLEEKIMLASGDHAYVQFPAGRAPKGGGRYTVYQVDREHPIREPGSTTVLGYLVHIYGEMVVEEEPGSHPVASARLLDLAAPVERGYQVGPLRRLFRSIVPKPNDTATTAHVVASVEPNMLIANEMFVVLDRGRRHGVDVGNRFLIVRQGDGLKRLLESWDATDPRFPPHAVAEILAVDVQNETTVGWVSRGSRELRVGDVADLRRGY